jgi:UDP-N-acetylmuramate--alanine ligase
MGSRPDAVCGTERIPLHLRLAGLHNVLNTLAAVTVAKRLHLANEIIAKGVATFEGVQRRLEVRGEINGTIIVDDYAHHATEMIASIAALRERYPDRRVLLVFQPHTYSRTRSFFEDLAGALCGADRTYLLDIYAARERDTLAMHSRDLAAAGEQLGASARYTGDMDTTIDAVRQEMRAGDLVVTMGAGDVYRVADALLAAEAATS